MQKVFFALVYLIRWIWIVCY